MAIRVRVPGLNRRADIPVEKRAAVPYAAGFSLGAINGGVPASSLPGMEDASYFGSEMGYRAVQLKVVNMAKLNLVVKTTTTDESGEEQVEIDASDPVTNLWNKNPGWGGNAVLFKRVIFGQYEKQGQAFVYTPRANATAVPDCLINVFGSVMPVVDNTISDDPEIQRRESIMPRIVGYWVYTNRGVKLFLPHEILWFRNPSFFNAYGADASWNAAAWPMRLDQFARQWQEAEFKNGAQPPGVVYLGDLTEEQAVYVKAQFEANHGGVANARRHLFTYGENAAQYSRIGTTPEEMSYNESHIQNQKDTLAALGIPIDKMMGETTFDNQAAADTALWADELDPTLELFEAEIDRHFFPAPNRAAVFDRSKVPALQENVDAINERARKLWEADITTMAEARRSVNLDPFNDERDEMTFTQYRTQFKSASPLDLIAANQDPNAVAVVPNDANPKDGNDAAQKQDENRSAPTVERRDSTGAEVSTGVMVGLWVPPAIAESLAVEGYEPADILHLTCAYLGKTTDENLDRETIAGVVRDIAAGFPPISGKVGGRGVFDIGDEGAVAIGLVDAVGLGELRARLVQALLDAGQNVYENHGFQPHISIGYTDDVQSAAAIPVSIGAELSWGSLTMCWGPERIAYPFAGTAVRSDLQSLELRTQRNPGYTKQETERLFDRYETKLKRDVGKFAERQKLVVLRNFKKAYRRGQINTFEQRAEGDAATPNNGIPPESVFDVSYWVTETGEVLSNVIESVYFDVGGAVGNGLGVSFDVLLPEIGLAVKERVANSALMVTETTRDEIGKILAAGVENFESIDEMARSIGGVFENLAGYRAERIARTEVAAAFNASSVIAAEASGATQKKKWLGAAVPCPDCVPLVGKEIAMNDEFVHEGIRVSHPPLHPNCRCTLTFPIDWEAVKAAEEAATQEENNG